MDRRFLTVLGMSLLFALVVSAIFYQFSKPGGPTRVTAPQEMKDLVIAAKPLSVGMTLKAEDVKVSQTPASAFPKGGFSKIEEIIERPVVSNILLEEPVLEGRLAPKGAGMGLAPVIPTGMRAVSVRVTDVVGVAGFVQPGLRVDVLVTGKPPHAQSTMTTTALQNILVLSSGTTLVADARGQAISAPSVTLLVTPEQAEVMTLASNEGRIQLVLRNSKDNDQKPTPGSNVVKLYANAIKGNLIPEDSPPPPVVRLPVKPPTPPLDQIVVIRGDKRTVETILQ